MADDTTPPDKQETTVPYSGESFDVCREIVAGDHEEFAVEYLDTDDAVTVIAFTPDDRVLVVEEWRQSVDRFDIGLPGGQLEADDADPAEAASRELREETGYEADRLIPMQSFEPLNSLLNTTIHLFVAEGCQPTGTRDPDVDEQIRVRTEPLETLIAQIHDGTIIDMKTAVTLLYYDSTYDV
ncbi:NUDIX hydrolase [Natronolimnohabitans sp. A-GB9]|uniref:NUDIX hydrolase n=1 Tax=Natronolimnohabitans sp. A-GB9 TaxID=3069757 RepID=UPI0027B156DD|nr:NUDIX hydrolase [Natronolimnohabitans sp. A-GB9]MDQ2052914.1 NUDIX hydrolase [Natronolimnohabitans sp. A-GB9]